MRSAYHNESGLGRLSFWLELLEVSNKEFIFLGGYGSAYTIFVIISISCDEVCLIFHIARACFQAFYLISVKKIIDPKSFFLWLNLDTNKKIVSAQMLFLRFLMLKNIIPCSCSAEVIQPVFWSRGGYLLLKKKPLL